MKKIILTMIFSLFYIVSASAGPGINVGISGNLGVFHGEATENENGDIDRDDATGVVGYGSVFIEKTLGERLAIGVDYVPQSLESEEASTSRLDKTTDDTGSTITNKVSLDFEDMTTVCLTLNLTEDIYVKAGYVQVDVITNETLGTGSTYADADMDGETYGIGYNKDFDNGMFARIEGTYMDLGSVSVTASNADNKVTINSLEGASARFSIGKSF